MNSAPTIPPHKDFERVGGARYYHRLTQGSDEWLQMRNGLLTASELHKVITAKTLAVANNADTRKHIYDLAAQRITKRFERSFQGWDMERGKLEEIRARHEYEKHNSPVAECGFVVNDGLGFELGFSPDGLVGDDGMIETKSRVSKYQLQTIVEHINLEDAATPIPIDFMLQCQGGLFVTGRKWCDFLSFSNGLNMIAIRMGPIPEYQEAIKAAATATEAKINDLVTKYEDAIASPSARVYPVEYVDYSEEIDL